jgi:hypothetical protein
MIDTYSKGWARESHLLKAVDCYSPVVICTIPSNHDTTTFGFTGHGDSNLLVQELTDEKRELQHRRTFLLMRDEVESQRQQRRAERSSDF